LDLIASHALAAYKAPSACASIPRTPTPSWGQRRFPTLTGQAPKGGLLPPRRGTPPTKRAQAFHHRLGLICCAVDHDEGELLPPYRARTSVLRI